jgi:hypothetical protein
MEKRVNGTFDLNGEIVPYAIMCYGELEENSNFSVVCEDEEFDDTWCEGNPNSAEYTFASWEEVCAELVKHFPEIEEIEAI